MRINIGPGEYFDVEPWDSDMLNVRTSCQSDGASTFKRRGREYTEVDLIINPTEALRLMEQLRLFVQAAEQEATDD